MGKKRINLLLEDRLYERLRAAAFLRRKTMSEIIREAIEKDLTGREELVLSTKKEEELLNILKENEFISEEEARKELGLE